jgi:hypothetical protein
VASGVPEPERFHLRASDADRERTVDLLRRHAGEGRLDLDELEARVERAYHAKTLGELSAIVADLPADPPLPPPPGAAPPLPPPPGAAPPLPVAARRRPRPSLLATAVRFGTIDAACIGAWAASGAHGGFWPGWVIFGTAVALGLRASHELEAQLSRSPRRRRR